MRASHEKIAIVGDSKWATEVLMFTGAGIRRTPIKFFPSDDAAQARAWLEK